MHLVCSVLGDDLHLRALGPAIFRVVIVGDYLDFLDGILIRSYDGSATPTGTDSCNTVNLVAVIAPLSASCANLAAVFNRKDTRRATRAPCLTQPAPESAEPDLCVERGLIGA